MPHLTEKTNNPARNTRESPFHSQKSERFVSVAKQLAAPLEMERSSLRMENSSTIRRFRLAHLPRQPEERPPTGPVAKPTPLMKGEPVFPQERITRLQIPLYIASYK